MKILHIHQYFNPGYGYQENIMPMYHKKITEKVLLITSDLSDGHNNEVRKYPVGNYIENNFDYKRIKSSGEFKGRFVFFKNLYKEIEEYNPDYIYHHSPTAPSLFTVSKYKKKYPEKKLVVDNHADLQISGRNRYWKWFYYNTLWKNLIKLCDGYIDCYFGVTPDRCLFLEKELGVDKNKIKLLPIGADTDTIDNLEVSISQFRNRLNIGSEDILFCHGGKMNLKKKTDDLLRAFTKCKNKKIKLVLFGVFEDIKLKELALSDDRIIFLGWKNREETIEILRSSDVGIWNGPHTTLLEDAVGCCLPLILKNYGSTSHLIEENGVFLMEGTEVELINVINSMSNKEYLGSLNKGCMKMKEKLSYDNIAAKSLKI